MSTPTPSVMAFLTASTTISALTASCPEHVVPLTSSSLSHHNSTSSCPERSAKPLFQRICKSPCLWPVPTQPLWNRRSTATPSSASKFLCLMVSSADTLIMGPTASVAIGFSQSTEMPASSRTFEMEICVLLGVQITAACGLTEDANIAVTEGKSEFLINSGGSCGNDLFHQRPKSKADVESATLSRFQQDYLESYQSSEQSNPPHAVDALSSRHRHGRSASLLYCGHHRLSDQQVNEGLDVRSSRLSEKAGPIVAIVVYPFDRVGTWDQCVPSCRMLHMPTQDFPRFGLMLVSYTDMIRGDKQKRLTEWLQEQPRRLLRPWTCLEMRRLVGQAESLLRSAWRLFCDIGTTEELGLAGQRPVCRSQDALMYEKRPAYHTSVAFDQPLGSYFDLHVAQLSSMESIVSGGRG
ncbi:hypothetical protein KCU61_g55, partial [Aureobasidium melanogenum]